MVLQKKVVVIFIPALPVMVKLPPTVATKDIIAQAKRFELSSRYCTFGFAN